MKRLILSASFVALALMLMSSANATPTCASLVTVNVNPGGDTTSISCTAFGLTFSNFAYSVAAGSGTPEIDLVNVGLVGGEIVLDFNPNLPVSGATDLHFIFEVTGTGIFDSGLANEGFNSVIQEKNCTIQFTGITPLDGICGGGDQLWNTSVGAGGARLCVFSTGCGDTNQTGDSSVNTLFVWKDIGIAANGSNSSFLEEFSTGVPEPMTLSLMGAGLLGLGFLRRFKK